MDYNSPFSTISNLREKVPEKIGADHSFKFVHSSPDQKKIHNMFIKALFLCNQRYKGNLKPFLNTSIFSKAIWGSFVCIFVTEVHFSTSDTHTTCVRIIYVHFKYTDASDALLGKEFSGMEQRDMTVYYLVHVTVIYTNIWEIIIPHVLF